MTPRYAVMFALALALAPLPGRAETSRVSLTAEVFTPEIREGLVPGDEVVWRWLDGTHDVVGYLGASFDSGRRTYGTASEFAVTYEGGIVRYRCTLHSRLTDGFRCAGMCGALADRALESVPPAAVIDSPSPGAIVPPDPSKPGLTTPTTVAGRASDDVAVSAVMLRLYDTTGKATEYLADCTGCGTPEASWSLTRDLLPGSYVAEAIAVDTSGNVPETFPRAHFFVL